MWKQWASSRVLRLWQEILCQGKVLVIDEAYNLDDNMFGKQAIDTLVEKVMGSPGEDIAVITGKTTVAPLPSSQ